MANDKLVVGATSTWNGKGINQAQGAIGRLESGVAKLGATMAGVFAFAKIEAFAKSSVTAFAQDQKQIEILNNSLKNVGFGYLSSSVDEYISKLALASDFTKSDLIPAYQQLLIATGSATKAQAVLRTAMNVSRGTGKDLSTVTTALGKAFLGNTTSLTRLGAGLDKVTLKGGNMNQILGVLTKLFHGDAAISAAVFAGQLQEIVNKADEVKVSIGQNMVNAIGQLDSKHDGIKQITRLMDDLGHVANAVVDDIAGIGLGIQALVNTTKPFISFFQAIGLMPKGASKPFIPKGLQGNSQAGLGGTGLTGAGAIPLPPKAAVPLTAAQQKELINKKQQALLDKAHLAIMKLSNQFDLKRIELNAVLMSNASDSQKMSAKAQLDLMDAQDKLTLANGAGAASALALADGQLKLLTNHQELSNAETALVEKAAALANAHDKVVAAAESAAVSLYGLGQSSLSAYQMYRAGERGTSTSNNNSYSVVINAPSGTTPDLVSAVQDAIQTLNRNGSPLAGGSSRGD